MRQLLPADEPGAGWRHMDIDYDNGEAGVELRQFNLACKGPRARFAYSW